MGVDKLTEEVAKKAMVAAANMVLDYRRKNPKSTEKDAIRFVMSNSNNIIAEVTF